VINNFIGSHSPCLAADCSTCRGLPRPLWSQTQADSIIHIPVSRSAFSYQSSVSHSVAYVGWVRFYVTILLLRGAQCLPFLCILCSNYAKCTHNVAVIFLCFIFGTVERISTSFDVWEMREALVSEINFTSHKAGFKSKSKSTRIFKNYSVSWCVWHKV
jgi:hypothetical protein